MNSYQSKKVSDIVSFKKYNQELYKLTYFKTAIRPKGYELDKTGPKRINIEKLDNNISRAKSKVFEYAVCNEFDYFVTLTIDGKKYKRDELSIYYKDFRVFLNNYNKNHKTKVEYIFIPEKHKDGNWHMHGLIKGIPSKHLKKNEHGYLDWLHYRERFGWISLDRVRSIEKVAKYITKYISKNLDNSIKELNSHMYYVTKGLNTAVELKKGTLCEDSIPYDFENDYVKIKWCKNDDIANLIDN